MVLSIGIGPFRASDLAPPGHIFKLRKNQHHPVSLFSAFAGYLFAPALTDLWKIPDYGNAKRLRLCFNRYPQLLAK
jgi:hypothetical protein